MTWFLRYSLYFLSGIVALAGMLVVYLLWFQPPFYFPKPTGPYAVGSKEYHWVDITRKNPLCADQNHPYMELMIKVWYPMWGQLPEKPTTPYARYFIDYFKKNVRSVWLFGFSRPIYSYAQPDGSIAQHTAPYPVIICSPGFGGTRESNTAHCENLASHGYIVVGISHTYDSRVVQFPDGRIAGGLKLLLQQEQGKNLTERRKLSEQHVEVRIADVRFVLDQLEKLAVDKNSAFYQVFDKQRIGIFGQSLGGSTAVQMSRHDARIKAGVDMDGSLFGPDATTRLNKPFMFLLAGATVKMFDGPMTQQNWKKFGITSLHEEAMMRERYLVGFEQIAKTSTRDVFVFVLHGADHINFTDSSVFKNASPFARLLIKLGNATDVEIGSIDGFRATEIVNAYLVNFFDKYLKGKPSALLDGTGSPYPEVEKRVYPEYKKL